MYLLRIKHKEDKTENVKIGFVNVYKEFDKLTHLVQFIHENAVFIESYTIFETKVFESSDDCCPDAGAKPRITISG